MRQILLYSFLTVIASVGLFGSDYVTDLGQSVATIREIIAKYEYTDKDTCHSYVESYASLLNPYKDRDCNILEIGTSAGGSAIIWHDWLLGSKLYLIDVRDSIQPHILSALQPDRSHIYSLCDGYTYNTLARLRTDCPEGFDIIIDDGSHNLNDLIFVLKNYIDLLKNDGLLILEDVQSPDWLPILNQNVPPDSNIQVEIVDLRRLKGRFDDLLFIVRKIVH